MNYQYKNLAAGKWSKMSFIEQMANIGSELERAINWKRKHNDVYFQRAFERCLELIDLTLDNTKLFSRLKELARIREAIVDYFLGSNQFKFTDESLKKYFLYFTFALRKNR